MAQKTVLKQLISKWGVMSIELQKAVQSDQAVIKEDGSFDYVDNPENETENTTNLKSNVENTLEIDDNFGFPEGTKLWLLEKRE